MTKGEFIKAVAEKAELTNKSAEAAVNAVIDTVIAELKKGEKVVIPGFGSFEARKKTAREGINPATGAKIKIAASVAPSFKAGKTFKDALN